MAIDFSKIEKTSAENFWGGEGTIYMRAFKDDVTKIMLARVEPGCSIGEHTHTTSEEIVYVLSGKGKTIQDGVLEEMEPGKAYYCPKGHTHTVFNDGTEPMTMYCVVVNL